MGLSHQLHPSESSCSASAQKIEEARFDLVISMVAEKDPLTSMVSCTASEERMAQISCRRLERKLLFTGMLPDVRFTQLESQTELLGHGASQMRIGLGGHAAKMVVEMADDEFPVTKGMQTE